MNHLFFPSLWRSSKLDQILDSNPHFSLDLLEQDDILEESRFLNEKLVRVLATREAVEALLDHMLNGPLGVDERPSAARFPNICCEILNYGISSINQTIFTNEDLLERFFAFLDKADTPLQNAVYFAKIVGMFLEHQKALLYNFLKERPSIVPAIIAKMHVGPFGDLVLSFIKADNSETVGFISWLNEHKLIPSMLAKLDDPDAYSTVCQLLSDIINVSSSPSELVSQLENPDCIRALLANALQGKPTSNLQIDGIDVVLMLVKWLKEAAERSAASHSAVPAPVDDFNPLTMDGPLDMAPRLPTPSPADAVAMETSPVVQTLYELFPQLMARLKGDAPDVGLPPTERPRFGSLRLKVLNLFLALLHNSSRLPSLGERLASLGLLPALIELIHVHAWNSLLHQVVEGLFRTAIDTGHEGLLQSLFVGGNLLQRVMDDFEPEQDGKIGFRAQLISLSNYLMQQDATGPFLRDNTPWHTFYSATIARLNRLHCSQLGTLAMTEFAPLVEAADAIPEAEDIESTSMYENVEGDQYSPPIEPQWQ